MHHLAGHIESLVLQNGEMPLPAVVLVVSGGHTSLYLVERPGAYQLLSRTRDDAAGEAYDKVAKLLGLGLSGRSGRRSAGADGGNDRAIAAADHTADACRSQRAAAEGRSRFQLQRIEDGSPAARPSGAYRRSASRRSLISARRFSASSSRRSSSGRSTRARRYQAQEYRYCGRRVGEQPAARRTPTRTATRREMPTFVPSLPALDRQRRNDRRRRASENSAPGMTVSRSISNADAALAL